MENLRFTDEKAERQLITSDNGRRHDKQLAKLTETLLQSIKSAC